MSLAVGFHFESHSPTQKNGVQKKHALVQALSGHTILNSLPLTPKMVIIIVPFIGAVVK